MNLLIRELESAVVIGFWCVIDDPTLQPSMKKVLMMLEGSESTPTSATPAFSLSIDCFAPTCTCYQHA